MSQNAHDYFKNMRKLFESTEVNEISDAAAASSTKKREANNRAGKDAGSEKLLKNYKHTDDREVRKTGKSSSKGPALGENRFAADNPDMDDNDMQDYWERKQEKADDKRKSDKEEPKKKDTKESAASLMRKYADFITEAENDEEWNVVTRDGQVVRGPYDDELSAHDALAKLKKSATDDDECSGFKVRRKGSMNESFGDDDDDEDPDVAKADKVKGKDGKTQADADKKLPPWLQKKGAFDKKDKKDEEKGAKKTKVEEGRRR